MNADANVRNATPRVAPVGHAPIATTQPTTDQSVHARVTPVGHGCSLGVVSGAERERLAAGFGRRLAELRAERQLTQKKAAARARISEDYWRHLEHGRRRPSADLVALLGLVLGGEDPWTVLEELLDLGGDALSGRGRRRFRSEAKRSLYAVMQLAKVRASTANELARIERITDKLDRRLAADQAHSIRAATQAIAQRQAERASAPRTSPQVRSQQNGRAHDVSTPPSLLDRLLGGEQ